MVIRLIQAGPAFQELMLPRHGHIFGTNQIGQRLQGPMDELWLESMWPHETVGTRAMHRLYYVLHTVLDCLGIL